MTSNSCVQRRRDAAAEVTSHANGHTSTPAVLTRARVSDVSTAAPASWTRTMLVLGAPCLTVLAAAVFTQWIARPPSLGNEYALCSPDGANIYTVDDALPNVQCIGVNGSYIFDRGQLADIRSRWGATRQGEELDVRMIDQGSVVLPGLSDSHAHILEYGASLVIPLHQARNVKDAVKFVKEYILSAPDVLSDVTKSIEGWGWDHTVWPGNAWPTAADFDEDSVLRGRRIVLQSKDGHALWVSSSVIEAMGSIPADIEGGVYTRTDSGHPAGVFIDKAQDYVPRDPLTDLDLERRFLATVDYAHRHGLTSIHDAGFSPTSLEFFKRQASEGPLPIRVYGMTYFDDAASYWGDKRDKVLDLNRLTARSVKMFADGALRSGYAALYEPYHDNHATKGVMRLTREVLENVVPRFIADGWQVNIHAIGDRANAIVLDAFESSMKNIDAAIIRPRLEHAQILTQADIKRIASLGIIASIQPTHAISDMAFAEARLGPERAKGIYAFRSLVDAGARVTFGSDAPVENLDPLTGFYAAVTRLSPEGTSPHGPEGWFPDQKLTRKEALRGMTISPAHASFTEDVLGSLEIGKRADFVVLSQDIMKVPVEAILSTEVRATVIDGRPVFGKV